MSDRLRKREWNGKTYYLIPGGTVEAGESTEAAATREIKEELGVEVCVGQLVAIVHFRGNTQYYFAATITHGEFGTGTIPELSNDIGDHAGTYTPIWMPLTSLSKEELRPRELAMLVLEAAESGWPDSPREIHDQGRDQSAPVPG